MIRLVKPYIAYDEVAADFQSIFESGMFTKGTFSTAFPEQLAAYTGARYGFNTTSATTALSACLAILDVGPGDDVIVSDFSFPATANVVEDRGARPVFADVSRQTFNMLPDQLLAKIGPATKAVIFVCAFGSPQGIEEIAQICKAHDLPLIVDAACAVGSFSNDVAVGSIGDLTCFSFHPRKLLTAGEGGAITTDNGSYADVLRVKLMHGSEVVGGRLEFTTYGYNYRLPELQCAMLIKQLAKLDAIVDRRHLMWQQYCAGLVDLGFHPQLTDEVVRTNLQSVVFTVPEGVSRENLSARLLARGVETTLGTYCLSGGQYFREKYQDVQPNADWLEKHTITLPCHDDVDVSFVVEAICASLGSD